MTINVNPQIWENSFGYKVHLNSHRQVVKSSQKVIFVFIDQQNHSERLQKTRLNRWLSMSILKYKVSLLPFSFLRNAA
ncbi:MAG: hypothetical protein F6K39_06950 [Okeania sp. SIO3B3]|nr:hypothetical protein [Okeania sp. SIO3B3]